MKRFTLTEEHLKLLRRAYVSWCGDEFGYIRRPEPGTREANAEPMLRAAIAKATGT